MTSRSVMQLLGPAVVAASVWFGVSWLPATLASADQRVADAEADRLQLTTELAAARSLPEVADELDFQIAAAAVAIPDTVQLAEFVRAAGEAADRTGVFVEQIAPLTVSSDTDAEATTPLPLGTSSVTVSIGARGAYADVMSFLDELRRLPRLVVIDLVDLTVDEDDPSQVILDVELRIFTTEVLVSPPETDEFDLGVEGDPLLEVE